MGNETIPGYLKTAKGICFKNERIKQHQTTLYTESDHKGFGEEHDEVL